MLTLNQIKKLCPKNKQPQLLVDTLNKFLPLYGITSKEQIACFLAQCSHESAQFTILKENLNYSADGLCKVWPKRFTSASMAAPYNRNPEKIANLVYCNRLGNGTESSGDGWKYRGRGAIQLTGKDNYSRFAKSINKSLDKTIAFCETLEGCISSACWFWSVNNLNQYCDSGDFITLTKRINGGTIGIKDRQHYYVEVLKVIDDDVFCTSIPDIVVPAVIIAPIVTKN